MSANVLFLLQVVQSGNKNIELAVIEKGKPLKVCKIYICMPTTEYQRENIQSHIIYVSQITYLSG